MDTQSCVVWGGAGPVQSREEGQAGCENTGRSQRLLTQDEVDSQPLSEGRWDQQEQMEDDETRDGRLRPNPDRHVVTSKETGVDEEWTQ